MRHFDQKSCHRTNNLIRTLSYSGAAHGTFQMRSELPSEDLQGLKPGSHFATVTARLKSCPCYKALRRRVFPQPVKATAPSGQSRFHDGMLALVWGRMLER